jgi:transposase
LVEAAEFLGAKAEGKINTGRSQKAEPLDPLHPPKLKKKARQEGAIIVHEDEASFRQTPTLCRTWARRGNQPQIPTLGQRNTQKILAAVCVPSGDFVWRHQTDYFNAQTYLSFLEGTLLPHCYRRRHRVFLIQDNASYHKKPEVLEFLRQNNRKIEVFPLPPYSPDFNAQERVGQYTRKSSTHNRYFDSPEALCETLFKRFEIIQRRPETIQGLLKPYF